MKQAERIPIWSRWRHRSSYVDVWTVVGRGFIDSSPFPYRIARDAGGRLDDWVSADWFTHAIRLLDEPEPKVEAPNLPADLTW